MSGLELELSFGEVETCIGVMQEVARDCAALGFRVWRAEWLTREALLTGDVREEHFTLGRVDGEAALALLLVDRDREYWPSAPAGEALYLHKFCVRRAFARQNMTARLIKTLRPLCAARGVKYLRLDTALDEEKVKAIYLAAGFEIIKTLPYPNGRAMALYELAL